MSDNLELIIGKLEGRMEYVAEKVDIISAKLDNDHDIMIRCGAKINGHIEEHDKSERNNRWKIGIMVGLLSVFVSLIVGLIFKA